MKLADAARMNAEAQLIRLRRRALHACLATILATDLVWCEGIGLSFGGLSRIIGAAAALALVAVLYRRRSAVLSGQAEATALWIAFTAGSGILTYLGATFALPWQDSRLDAADHALGFDWAIWRDRAEALPPLHQLLVIAYFSLLAQILIAVLFFPATGRTARGLELILLATGTIIPTTIIAAFWPALGPFSLHGGHGSWWADLLALRQPGPWHFQIAALEGVISMPSYHATLCALFLYGLPSHRRCRLGHDRPQHRHGCLDRRDRWALSRRHHRRGGAGGAGDPAPAGSRSPPRAKACRTARLKAELTRQ